MESINMTKITNEQIRANQIKKLHYLEDKIEKHLSTCREEFCCFEGLYG